MKILSLLIATVFVSQMAWSQIAGNINNEPYTLIYPESNINISQPRENTTNISIKGIANIKPDALVAVYAVIQSGNTIKETNDMMDERIDAIKNQLKAYRGIDIYVDMITMLPLYDVVRERKRFSKTYNEVPTGFELKKNIHVKFKNGNQINEIMKVLAQYEVYDLIKVDYSVNNIDSIKKEMMNKAKLIMQDRIKLYEGFMGNTLSSMDKYVNDGFKMYLPAELYRKYTGYQNTSMKFTNDKTYGSNVNQIYKSSAVYYSPVANKEFDFVINPTVLEPSVQVLYELKWSANQKEVEKQQPVFIIGNNGEIKTLNLNK